MTILDNTVEKETPFSEILSHLRTHVRRQKDVRLLMEAYRRKMMFHPERPLKGVWLGLGTPSQYKSEFFTTANGQSAADRATQWWVLSSSGIETLEFLIVACPFPADDSTRDTLNTQIFSY